MKYWSDNMQSVGGSGQSGSGIDGAGGSENGFDENESGDESDDSSNNDPHDLLIDNSDESQQWKSKINAKRNCWHLKCT